MLLSIIIPCYNSEKTIISTLESVENQTLTDWECIIVNDGSTDKSGELIEKFIVNKPKFTLISVENGGVAKARNIALEHSKGKYILPLDSDDLLMCEYTQYGTEYLENNPECSLYYGEAILDTTMNARSAHWVDYKTLLKQSNIHVSGILRKELIQEGWNPEVKVLEDWEFYIRYLYHHDNVHVTNSWGIIYRLQPSAKNTDIKALRKHCADIMRMHIDKQVEYGNAFRIGFYGFWENDDVEEFKKRAFLNALENVLYKECNPLEEECDLVIASVFPPAHFVDKDKIALDNCNFKGNPTIITYRGEPEGWYYPIEQLSPYHLGFKPYSKTECYYPLWMIQYDDFRKHYKKVKPKKTDFCCYIVSNPDSEYRNDIFHYISENYKKVDSLGEYENSGYVLPRGDFDYPAKYKFILCCENTKTDKDYWYITEKLLWAFAYGCVPIYCGNNKVEEYFNKEAFINATDLSKEEILEKIKELDNNPELYNKMLNTFPIKKKFIDVDKSLQPLFRAFVDMCLRKDGKKTLKAYGI